MEKPGGQPREKKKRGLPEGHKQNQTKSMHLVADKMVGKLRLTGEGGGTKCVPDGKRKGKEFVEQMGRGGGLSYLARGGFELTDGWGGRSN